MKKTILILLIFAIPFFTSSYISADITSGLVAYYPFNGNANDESGNGNHGTNNGAEFENDRFGNVNSSLSFNLIFDFLSDYMVVSSPNNIPFGDSPRTISAWIKNEGTGNTWGSIITMGQGDCTGNMFGLGIQQNKLVHWGGCKDFVSDYYVPQNQWVFVAAVYDGSKIKLWVNSQMAFTTSTDYNTQNSDIWIGAETTNNGSSFRSLFYGFMDDVSIYNRALSDEDITELYTSTSPPFLEITYPNTKETLMKETDYTLTWESGDIVGDIQIDLYKGDTHVLQIADSAPNTGTYLFTLPESLENGNDYRFAISAMGGTILDFSDSYFSITFEGESLAMEVTACSPGSGANLNGTHNLFGNSLIPNQNNITSISVNMYAFHLSNGTNCGDVSLRLCSDINCDDVLAISYLDSNLLPAVHTSPKIYPNNRDWVKFTFDNPVNIIPGTTYYFLYSTEGCKSHNFCIDVGDPYEDGHLIGSYSDPPNRDTSFRTYYKTSPYIIVQDPNGWEELIINQPYTIKWYSGNIAGNVQIDLYKGGTHVTEIASNVPNTGIYSFTPSAGLQSGNDYQIAVTALSGEDVDFSDSYFTITSTPGVLFTDDYNDGNELGWEELNGNWAVESGEYSSELNGCNLPGNVFAGTVNWSNYVFETDVIRKDGVGTSITFRQGDYINKNYVLGFRTGWQYDYGQDYAFLCKNGGCDYASSNMLEMINYTFPLNIWHRLRVEATGNNIKAYIKERDQVDYFLLFDYTDNDNPHLKGKVGISEWSGGACSSHNHFDNVSISSIINANNAISGSVTLSSPGSENVVVNLSGELPRSLEVGNSNTYSFMGLVDGNYTVTPTLSGYTFDPPTRNVSILGASVDGQDFRGCDSSVPLSGLLRDKTTESILPGVTITVDGIYTDITDSNGLYEIHGLSCGIHEVSVDVPSGYVSYSRTTDTFSNTVWDINLTKPQTVYGPQTPSGYSKDPVNTATGNYVYQRKDLKIPGKGIPFVFERNYNSQDATDGPLGYGWGHTYNVSFILNPDSSITIRWGDGKTQTWTPDGLGGFTPQYGVFDTLIDNGDGTYALKKKDLTEYNFNTSNRLSSIVDRNGNTISLAYSGNNLTQITDTAGRNINLTLDGNNRIKLVTDPIGRTLQFSYDANGDLVTATDMNGNVTTYTYDADHQILTVVDPRGNTVVTNGYDTLKRVVTSQSDAKGGVTSYTYDEVNKKTTLVDQLGYTTIHYHDELLRLIQETDDLGNSAYYVYDSAGNRIKVTDKNGNETNYTYDSNGNVLTKTDALGNVTTITYDSINNPLTRTDALDNVTTFEYDANGNLTKTTDPLGNFTSITYDSNGQPLTVTDARGNASTNSYDIEGNLSTITDALGNTTTYTYDGVSRRITIIDALGRTTTYSYDNNNNLLSITDPLGNISQYVYDGNNNKISITDPLGNTTSYAYDVKDLLTTITDPHGSNISYSYDGLDRRISSTDKNGNVTNYSFDSEGNLLTVTDALGNETTYTYDANGNRLTATNPLGNTATYSYDSLNRLVSETDPLGNVTATNYDALDKITTVTNANSQTTGFEYNALGRLTKVTDANGGIVTYTYDENGNRLTMTDPNGNTTSYTYDALNRVIQKLEPLGNTYQYAYDAAGNRISLTDANGNTINYSYDANDRLSSISYPDASTVTFFYDANGNRIQMVDGLGTSTYTYNALNRMISYNDPFGKTIGYGYDANGNRTSLTYPDSKAVTYFYDAANRLSSVIDWLSNITTYTYDDAGYLTNTLNPNNTTASFTYDTAGRVIGLLNEKSDSTVISSYSYTLDAIGNHTSTVKDEPLMSNSTRKNISYSYDAENRLAAAGSTAYSYDSNGNMTAKGSDTYSYDYEDRLVQSNIAGENSQYSYDGLGNRFLKNQSGTNTRYVLDVNGRLSNVLAETDNSGAIKTYYIYGLGLISKVLPDGTASYYHYDSRGSTIALSDASETLTDTYAYDTFGNLANSQGTTLNPFKYVGRHGVMDEGNGFNFIRARYYSPDLGRFVSKDPITGNIRDGQSLNRYIYALNNPVRLIDVSGFSAIEGGVSTDLSASSDWRNNLLISDGFDTSTAGSTQMIILTEDENDDLDRLIVKKTFWNTIQETGKAALEYCQNGAGSLVDAVTGSKKIIDVSNEVDKYDTEDELIFYIDEQYNSNEKAKSLIDAQVDGGNWGRLSDDQKKNELEIALQALGGRGKLSTRVMWDALFK